MTGERLDGEEYKESEKYQKMPIAMEAGRREPKQEGVLASLLSFIPRIRKLS